MRVQNPCERQQNLATGIWPNQLCLASPEGAGPTAGRKCVGAGAERRWRRWAWAVAARRPVIHTYLVKVLFHLGALVAREGIRLGGRHARRNAGGTLYGQRTHCRPNEREVQSSTEYRIN